MRQGSGSKHLRQEELCPDSHLLSGLGIWYDYILVGLKDKPL
jgi:hypothetical protein